jgi:hypothetical protein
VFKENGLVGIVNLWFDGDDLHIHVAAGDRNNVSEFPHAVLREKEKALAIDHSKGEVAVELMRSISCAAVAFINEVNAAGGLAYVASPHKANARRKAKGKRPLLIWTTINLDAPRYVSEPKGGTHASPRLHDRRGHWVTSKLGKRFWRKESKVGSAKNGITIQSYEKGAGMH